MVLGALNPPARMMLVELSWRVCVLSCCAAVAAASLPLVQALIAISIVVVGSRMHPSSQAYGAECDIFLWLSPSSECVLTHAHLSNSIDIRRDGKGYPIERMSSCAQSAQLVVCSADSHTLAYDRKGAPARARTALWWSSGETVRLVHR